MSTVMKFILEVEFCVTKIKNHYKTTLHQSLMEKSAKEERTGKNISAEKCVEVCFLDPIRNSTVLRMIQQVTTGGPKKKGDLHLNGHKTPCKWTKVQN